VGASIRLNSWTLILDPRTSKSQSPHFFPPHVGRALDEEELEEDEDPQLSRLLAHRGRQVLNPGSACYVSEAEASARSAGPHLSSLYSKIYDMEQGAAEEQLMMWQSALEGGASAVESREKQGNVGRENRAPCGSSLLSFFGVCAPEAAATGGRKYRRGT